MLLSISFLLVMLVKLDSEVFGGKKSLSVILNSRKIVKWDNYTAKKKVSENFNLNLCLNFLTRLRLISKMRVIANTDILQA